MAEAPSCFGPGCRPLTRMGRGRAASCADGASARVSRWQARKAESRKQKAEILAAHARLWRSISAFCFLLFALHTWHPVLIEDLFDLAAPALDRAIELLAQRVVAAAHAHRD